MVAKASQCLKMRLRATLAQPAHSSKAKTTNLKVKSLESKRPANTCMRYDILIAVELSLQTSYSKNPYCWESVYVRSGLARCIQCSGPPQV
eukprot:644729-Amphidinium_carterae.1